MAKLIKLHFPMEVDVDPQEEQIEELKQDKNMYWKIIVSLQHKIQSLVKSVEYIAEENDRQGRDLLRWETGEEVKELVEGVELKTPVLTGANPGSVHYQGGETKFANLPFHNYEKESPTFDSNDQKLLDSLPYKTLTAKQREVVAVYYNPNGSAYGNQSLTAKAIYGNNSSKSRVKINQILKRIEIKLNKS